MKGLFKRVKDYFVNGWEMATFKQKFTLILGYAVFMALFYFIGIPNLFKAGVFGVLLGMLDYIFSFSILTILYAFCGFWVIHES